LTLRLRGGIRRQKAGLQTIRTVEESMDIVTPETGKGITL
jgi:hypothetical protein